MGNDGIHIQQPQLRLSSFAQAKLLIGYQRYSLNVTLTPGPGCVPLHIDRIKDALSKRNWFWRGVSQGERSRAIERITALLDKLSAIRSTDTYKRTIGQDEVVSVYTTGSYPWHDAPGDIDIYFIVKGKRPFKLTPLPKDEVDKICIAINPGGKIIGEIALQVVGLDDLASAAKDKHTKDCEVLQRKLLTLYGNGVHLAGADMFDNVKPPINDLLILAHHLRSIANKSEGLKKEKRLREAALVEDFVRDIR